MTNYICIRCNNLWKIDNGDLDPIASGALCDPCLRESLTPLYRRRQLKEGNFDCFAKAEDYCDQHKCKYRKLCLKKKNGRTEVK